MFDGSFKRRRAVNLGGKRRQGSSDKNTSSPSSLDSKKDFISRARLERNARAQQRQRDDAVLILQRWGRKAIVCKRLNRNLYQAWVSKIQDIEKVNQMLGSPVPLPPVLVAQFVRQFNVRFLSSVCQRH